MSKPERQKLSILVVLLGVLALTIILGYRMNKPAVTAAVQVPETKPSPNSPVTTDARIRLDLIKKPQGASDVIGKKNVFQYGQNPAPASGPGRSSQGVGTPPPVSPILTPPAANRPPAAIAPPGPP